MNKNILCTLTLLVTLLFGFTSCAEDTPVTDPYADWQARNDHYLDSIVDVARRNADGNWVCVRDFRIAIEGDLSSQIPLPGGTEFEMTDSVYVHFSARGDASGEAPLFTDSVSVYYQGWLMNGERFDGNFYDEWKNGYTDQIYSPSTFLVQGVVAGWQTALMANRSGYPGMRPGDRADVFIPSELAYGEAGSQSIRGHSVLRFHMKVEEVIHPKGPDDRALDSEQ